VPVSGHGRHNGSSGSLPAGWPLCLDAQDRLGGGVPDCAGVAVGHVDGEALVGDMHDDLADVDGARGGLVADDHDDAAVAWRGAAP